MDAYRKTIELDRDKSYWFVDLGPIPGKPDWHMKMYEQVSYAFPSLESATRFAVAPAWMAQVHSPVRGQRAVEARAWAARCCRRRGSSPRLRR